MMATDEYLAYLGRFEGEVGSVAVGGYGKWRGTLVRKLSEREFNVRFGEYHELDRTYRRILERGDTLNDALTKILRERRTELLLPENQ